MTIDEKGQDPIALAEQLEAHMGLADRADLLRDCRLAASVIRRLAYESAKQKDAEGWRDIASAPKDWSDVMLCDPERDRDVFEGYYSCADGGDDCWKDASGEPCAPTMWRPLPQPPSALLSAGGEG